MGELTILSADVEGGVSIVVEMSDDTFAIFTIEQLQSIGRFRALEPEEELPLPQ